MLEVVQGLKAAVQYVSIKRFLLALMILQRPILRLLYRHTVGIPPKLSLVQIENLNGSAKKVTFGRHLVTIENDLTAHLVQKQVLIQTYLHTCIFFIKTIGRFIRLG